MRCYPTSVKMATVKKPTDNKYKGRVKGRGPSKVLCWWAAW